MAQNDLASLYISMSAPMWNPEQMPSFLRGMASRGNVTSSVRKAVESFGPSMNAFASIIVPADPDVPGDQAAGELGGGSFFKQMIRLIRLGTVPELGAVITEDDARHVFGELDEHARSDFGGSRFDRLTPEQQQQLVDALLEGTLEPLTVTGPDAALVLQSQGRLMVILVKVAYGTNYPEHRVRSGPLGFGEGRVIFSDPANQISNPNVRGTGTAWDYLGWHFPLRIGVEEQVALAFLEAEVPQLAAASEAALADLLAKDAARTLIDED